MTDRSSQIKGVSLPPGLRFPSGAICGKHLIFAGTYLSQSYQSFSIWALDLVDMSWTRIDTGTILSTGSWSKGVSWSSPSNCGTAHSKFVVFGNRAGNLVEDYNRRLQSWDDVTLVDLEAFGIYQPPKSLLAVKSQEFGLAALEEGLFADFEVVCDDGRKVKCSRKVLEGRWPWFKQQRKVFLEAASRALDSVPSTGDVDHSTTSASTPTEPTPDPRFTPRTVDLSEPYPVTLALLQYFYSLSLLTPLQHAPAVLSQLLLLSVRYELPHLKAVVQHAMHMALSPSTSVGVYEVATLCSCQSLQIRALKFVMVGYSFFGWYVNGLTKILRVNLQSSNRRGANASRNHPQNGGHGADSGGGGVGGERNGSSTDTPGTARPRGFSDGRSPIDRSVGGSLGSQAQGA